MLAAAYVSNVAGTRYAQPKSISVTACEAEPGFLPYLEDSLDMCAAVCEQAGITFNYKVVHGDFVQTSIDSLHLPLFSSGLMGSFNTVIVNPPYRKIGNASHTKKVLDSAGVSVTNLYTAFLWLAAEMLESGGQMVSITPRSFANGPYFLPFRKFFLRDMAIEKIHVFEDRDRAFNEDDVLQENVILLTTKHGPQTHVHVTSSEGPEWDFKQHRIPYEQLVHPNDRQKIIHIATSIYESRWQEMFEHLQTRLSDLKIEVSTRRVVDFRAREWLTRAYHDNVVPLIYPAHFCQGVIKWPNAGFRKPSALRCLEENDNLLVPTGFYVLVKRFSAKEERRRITAAVFDPGLVHCDAIGFENHLNYYHSRGHGLPELLAKGLTLYLNSTLVDIYFRQFSGHTQVNVNDLKYMKYPDMAALLRMGRHFNGVLPSQYEIDQIVVKELEMDGQMTLIDAKRKIEEALGLLRAIGVPRGQQNDRSALTLLALLDLKPTSKWAEASAPLRGITQMMEYFREHYGVDYAPNTRETVRRQTIHQFEQLGLIIANPDDPTRPTNSPDYCYQVTQDFLTLVRSFGSKEWRTALEAYSKTAPGLMRLSPRTRVLELVPVTLPDGSEIKLTPGGQNVLIKQIIEEFCPRFTPGGKILYWGDAGKKLTEQGLAALGELGYQLDKHGKMPDVIVYLEAKGWLVLIEAVTSHGPIDIKRHNELTELFGQGQLGLVFVTAFETRQAMAKYLSEISWETEVWIAEAPDHLIHFDGKRFLGPYNNL